MIKDLVINADSEAQRITDFIRKTVKNNGFEKVIVGVSGGVDSATVLALCVRALGRKNVIVVKMPYGVQEVGDSSLVIEKAGIPEKNILELNVKQAVDVILGSLAKQDDSGIKNQNDSGQARMTMEHADLIRIGNIMARVRMIVLFDLAKKYKALVCGTENRTEHLLGYYTRFGDEASDIEPIRHLFKTQVYQLAEYLEVPVPILKKKPSAGLWEGQTDEEEFGFDYKTADEILFWRFEKKIGWEEIKRKAQSAKRKADQAIVEKVKKYYEKNRFKQNLPYLLQ